MFSKYYEVSKALYKKRQQEKRQHSYDPGYLTDRNRFGSRDQADKFKFTPGARDYSSKYRPRIQRNLENSDFSPSRINLDKHDRINDKIRQRSIELDYDSVERRFTFDGSKDVKSWLDNLEKKTADQLITMTERNHYRHVPKYREHGFEAQNGSYIRQKAIERIEREERRKLLKLNLNPKEDTQPGINMFGKKKQAGPTIIDINKEREWLKSCKLEIQAHSKRSVHSTDKQQESVIDQPSTDKDEAMDTMDSKKLMSSGVMNSNRQQGQNVKKSVLTESKIQQNMPRIKSPGKSKSSNIVVPKLGLEQLTAIQRIKTLEQLEMKHKLVESQIVNNQNFESFNPETNVLKNYLTLEGGDEINKENIEAAIRRSIIEKSIQQSIALERSNLQKIKASQIKPDSMQGSQINTSKLTEQAKSTIVQDLANTYGRDSESTLGGLKYSRDDTIEYASKGGYSFRLGSDKNYNSGDDMGSPSNFVALVNNPGLKFA